MCGASLTTGIGMAMVRNDRARGMIVLKAFDTVFGSVALGLAAFVLAVLVTPGPMARAQDAAPAVQPAAAPAKAAAQKAPAQKAATSAASPAPSGGDAALRQRVEQLEEQIVDMQVVIGTLESLAKAPPPSASSAPSRGMGGADNARVDRLESQLQALSAQMQQMSNKSPASQPDRRSELAPTPSAAPQPPALAATGSVSSFGSTTVTSDQGDPIGGILAGNAPPAKVGEAFPICQLRVRRPGRWRLSTRPRVVILSRCIQALTVFCWARTMARHSQALKSFCDGTRVMRSRPTLCSGSAKRITCKRITRMPPRPSIS